MKNESFQRMGRRKSGRGRGAARILASLCATVLGWAASGLLNAQTVDTLLNSGLIEPHSIVHGTNTVFYLSDGASHRVLKFDSKNGQVTSLAGINGQAGSADGIGFLAKFNSPKGMVMSSTRGGLLVADSGNHTVRLIKNLSGSVAVVTNFAGSAGIRGAASPSGQNVPLGSALFNTPIGLAADASGAIYVADSKNNAIRKIHQVAGIDYVTTLSTNFVEPAGIAYDDTNHRLYVADSRNHAIKFIDLNSNTVFHFAGSTNMVAGTADALFVKDALFNQPNGLIWVGGTTGLLVADTGNHVLRRIYRDAVMDDPVFEEFFPGLQEWEKYSVQTYAGSPRVPGSVDGELAAARFNSPVTIARDQEGNLLLTDMGNRAVRRIQTAPKLPKIGNPKIGYVTFVLDPLTGNTVTKLVPFSDATFYSDPIIAVLAEGGTESFYTFGATPGLLDADNIPVPDSFNSLSAPPYADGADPSSVKPSIVSPQPDVTVKVVSTSQGRRPSDLVKARIQFKTSPVTIDGDNPALFSITSETPDAAIWYTLDGTVPTNQPPSIQAVGASLSIVTNQPFVFRARAFRENYKPSEIATKNFSPTDFQANRISFGFERGEASSDFVASPGQKFYAPVTLSLLPKARIYSLQFNVGVTANEVAPAVTPGAIGFQSMLMEEIPPGKKIFRTIPPAMFITGANPPPSFITNAQVFAGSSIPIANLLVTNAAANIIGVGWLERAGATNLYNTIKQDLVTFSIAHDTLFTSGSGKAVVGAYSFVVPGTAVAGQSYQINIGRPSATSDGIGGPGGDVYIDLPSSGSFGPGAINGVKNVTIGQRKYVVGDVAPFRWVNAGDFGNTNIFNDDVMQVFQSAIYSVNSPIMGSDLFDAMDSCCTTGTAAPGGGYLVVGNTTYTGVGENVFFDGNDLLIDDIAFGDGSLNVTDVYVTFRRSIDPTRKWYQRFWANGVLAAELAPNLFRGKPNLPAEQFSNADALAQSGDSNEQPTATVEAPDIAVAGGQTVDIPIHARITGRFPARIWMLNLSVEPLEGAPPLAEPAEFIPNAKLGRPALASSRGNANYAGAWLDRSAPGITGDSQAGVLRVTLPENLPAGAAYRVKFDHASVSPNGMVLLPLRVKDGLLLTTPRDGASLNDGIPDSWRLRHFGTTESPLAAANADADGDGVPNWIEFKAGTNPADPASKIQMKADRKAAVNSPRGVALRWSSAPGKKYAIEEAASLEAGNWTSASSAVTGTGFDMEFTPPESGSNARFYRVRLVE